MIYEFDLTKPITYMVSHNHTNIFQNCQQAQNLNTQFISLSDVEL